MDTNTVHTRTTEGELHLCAIFSLPFVPKPRGLSLEMQLRPSLKPLAVKRVIKVRVWVWQPYHEGLGTYPQLAN